MERRVVATTNSWVSVGDGGVGQIGGGISHEKRNGLHKKAYELSVLCDAVVASVVFSSLGHLLVMLEKMSNPYCINYLSYIVIFLKKRARKHPSGDNIQIDTKDILFICGGAFVDLDKTISERRQDSSIAFGASVRANMRTTRVINATVTSSLLESGEN